MYFFLIILFPFSSTAMTQINIKTKKSRRIKRVLAWALKMILKTEELLYHPLLQSWNTAIDIQLHLLICWLFITTVNNDFIFFFENVKHNIYIHAAAYTHTAPCCIFGLIIPLNISLTMPVMLHSLFIYNKMLLAMCHSVQSFCPVTDSPHHNKQKRVTQRAKDGQTTHNKQI